MPRLNLVVIIITAAAILIGPCCCGHSSADLLPRKWLATTDKRSPQNTQMSHGAAAATATDPCQKERSMKMICHCDRHHPSPTSNPEVRAAECWILRNDLTAQDPLWKALERHSTIEDLKFIVQSGSLSFLPVSVFRGLHHLSQVSVSFSNVPTISSNTFVNSSSLRTVRLNHNNITSVEKLAFNNNAQLERIDLEENELTKIDSESFANLPKLYYLALNNNKIRDLQRGAFRTLKNLLELQLQHNLLPNLTADLFLGLENLKVLKLSDNRITSLQNGVFIELWSLQELHLDSNRIETISERAFDGLNNLRRLSLQRNQLKVLAKSLFASLPVLSWLNLSENHLKFLHPDTFAHLLDNFQHIDSSLSVNRNHLICDCTLNWLIELRNSTRSVASRQSLDRLKCLLANSHNNNDPEHYLRNSLEIPAATSSGQLETGDYNSEETYAMDSVDLSEGTLVNLALLDQLPCHEDESDPTSLPLPRESTGASRDHGISASSAVSGTTVIILSAFVILHNNILE